MKEKVIWITGASSGIGAELAKQYSNKGHFLILSARNQNTLAEVQASLEASAKRGVLPKESKTRK